jgi:hypothetical protein
MKLDKLPGIFEIEDQSQIPSDYAKVLNYSKMALYIVGFCCTTSLLMSI